MVADWSLRSDLIFASVCEYSCLKTIAVPSGMFFCAPASGFVYICIHGADLAYALTHGGHPTRMCCDFVAEILVAGYVAWLRPRSEQGGSAESSALNAD